MIEVSVVYSDEKQIEKVRELDNGSLTFNFIDITTKKGKKPGFKLKSHWAARKDPFIIVSKDKNPVRAFYSEAGDAINNLIQYLNEEM